jgi:hypothetical protein
MLRNLPDSRTRRYACVVRGEPHASWTSPQEPAATGRRPYSANSCSLKGLRLSSCHSGRFPILWLSGACCSVPVRLGCQAGGMFPGGVCPPGWASPAAGAGGWAALGFSAR